jgi:hypothetical protein
MNQKKEKPVFFLMNYKLTATLTLARAKKENPEKKMSNETLVQKNKERWWRWEWYC